MPIFIIVFFLCSSFLYADPLQVGSQKQLFIDHKFIESSEGIELVVQEPFQTREKLIVADQPWEEDAVLGSYSTVVQEGDKIRLWYDIRAGAPPRGERNPRFMGMGYAESSDGIHFTKPVLNLVERNGTRKNNLVLPPNPDQLAIGGGSVWRDDNPNCPPEARYKSWTKIYPRKNSGIRGPHRIFVSPDGFHWKLDEREFSGLRAADTQPSWFWEPRIQRYIGYAREWVRERPGFGVRTASYNESDDCFNWDNMAMVLEPDERDCAVAPAMRIDVTRMEMQGGNIIPQYQRKYAKTDGEDPVWQPMPPMDFYGPGVFPYEGIYFALTPVFYHWKGSGHDAWPSTADLQLAVSRDARHFMRPGTRQPFLRPGPDGSWDSKWIYPVLRPVRMGDELWIYYFGTNRDHARRLDSVATRRETAISRAILRLDGFIAAVAAYTGGRLISPALSFQGNRLELNLDTGAGGFARVEILDEDGKPVPGFTFHDADELNGNNVKMPVTWRGNPSLAALAGKPIRLHIRMRSAKLYAFQFLP